MGLSERRRAREVVGVRDPGRMGTRATWNAIEDVWETVKVGDRIGKAAPSRVAGAYCVGIGLGWLIPG